jgi:hypothetical protein
MKFALLCRMWRRVFCFVGTLGTMREAAHGTSTPMSGTISRHALKILAKSM